MKLVKFGFVFLFVLSFVNTAAFAEVTTAIDLALRTRPKAANAVGTLAYEGLLWGEADKLNPMYGYFKVGGKSGGTPTAAAFVQIAPIAPLILEAQSGFTQRGLKAGPLNCDDYDCLGRIERTDYSARLVGGYKEAVFMATYLTRQLKTGDSNKEIALESEAFSVAPGNYALRETSLMAGYKLNTDQLAAIVHSVGTLDYFDKKYSATYAVYRFPWQDFTWSLAAGKYNSDQSEMTGFSAVLGISRRWGNSLSLF